MVMSLQCVMREGEVGRSVARRGVWSTPMHASLRKLTKITTERTSKHSLSELCARTHRVSRQLLAPNLLANARTRGAA